MKTHLSKLLGALATVVVLALSTGIGLAQSPTPKDPAAPAQIAPGAIPVQGRLTNAAGVPLTGTYSMTFRLYEAVDTPVGSALCLDTRNVEVVNGLFYDVIDHCYDNLNGQKVWLGIQVGADAEMTPRQVVYPAPYAVGLVPGTVMNANYPGAAVTFNNEYSTGTVLKVQATAGSGTNYGVYASNASPSGTTGYFANLSNGTGVRAVSVGGAGLHAGSLDTAVRAEGTTTAISAEGSGVIKSTAVSYLWVSGNNLRPYYKANSLSFEINSTGGVVVSSVSTGLQSVFLPITMISTLYGQNITVSMLDIYWTATSTVDGIQNIRLRRATGTGWTQFVDLVSSATKQTCNKTTYPNGCIDSYPISSSNTLSDVSGILYLGLDLYFNSTANEITIGGIRLTLQHD